MKKYLLAILALVISARASFAMIVESGSTVVITAPVYEDVYVAGGTIIINAPIHGSLIVAAGRADIKDTVDNDILLAGGEVSFDGYVGGTIRCTGGRLYIRANISKDLVLAAGAVDIAKTAIVFGNLLATGGSITLDGTVMNNVQVRVGTFWLNGKVNGDLDCRAQKMEINGFVKGKATLSALDGISIGSAASFATEIRYWTPDNMKPEFGHSLQVGSPRYDPSLEMLREHWYFLGADGFAGLLWHLGMILVLIMTIQYLFAATMRGAGNTIFDHPVRSLGWGLLFLCATPVLAVLLFFSVIGIPIGLALAVIYLSALLLAGSITAVVAANWLNDRSQGNWKFIRLVAVAFGIFLLLRLVMATPFLGWLAILALAATALGAILQNIHWKKAGTGIMGNRLQDQAHRR